eukprot:SAG25_NODE_802_length_5262_cov_30.348441_4_plen_47_part_00
MMMPPHKKNAASPLTCASVALPAIISPMAAAASSAAGTHGRREAFS